MLRANLMIWQCPIEQNKHGDQLQFCELESTDFLQKLWWNNILTLQTDGQDDGEVFE